MTLHGKFTDTLPYKLPNTSLCKHKKRASLVYLLYVQVTGVYRIYSECTCGLSAITLLTPAVVKMLCIVPNTCALRANG